MTHLKIKLLTQFLGYAMLHKGKSYSRFNSEVLDYVNILICITSLLKIKELNLIFKFSRFSKFDYIKFAFTIFNIFD